MCGRDKTGAEAAVCWHDRRSELLQALHVGIGAGEIGRGHDWERGGRVTLTSSPSTARAVSQSWLLQARQWASAVAKAGETELLVVRCLLASNRLSLG